MAKKHGVSKGKRFKVAGGYQKEKCITKERNIRWFTFPRRRGTINLSTNLASLESVLKVKCFMFRNSWADCCCSCNHLIVSSDFFSSLHADDTTSVNLQNETTEVVCFLVSLRSYHTTTEKFENTALFLPVGPPSTLIRHANPSR